MKKCEVIIHTALCVERYVKISRLYTHTIIYTNKTTHKRILVLAVGITSMSPVSWVTRFGPNVAHRVKMYRI